VLDYSPTAVDRNEDVTTSAEDAFKTCDEPGIIAGILIGIGACCRDIEIGIGTQRIDCGKDRIDFEALSEPLPRPR